MSAARFADTHIPTVLDRLGAAVRPNWQEKLRRQKIGIPEWRVLAALYDAPPQTVNRLAEICVLLQPTMSKLLDRMSRDGLVTRTQDARDRRAQRVALTSRGLDLAKRLVAQALEHECMLLSRYPALAEARLPETLALMERGGGA